MTCNRIFLRSIFVAGTIVLCCGHDVSADDLPLAIGTFIPIKPTVSICPAGQYVYKCGNYRVGFYWLKSAKFPDSNANANANNTEDDNENNDDNNSNTAFDWIETKNYYDAVHTTLELFEQMRKFFSSQDTDDTIEAINEPEVSHAVYIEDRELILTQVCDPTRYTVTCAPCPNNANVPASSVQKHMLTNEIIANSWNFHTIADCYMEEFTDSTGTYYYVQPNTTNNPEQCYYTNTNPDALSILNGDAIGTFVPGLTIGTINVQEAVVTIPATTILPR